LAKGEAVKLGEEDQAVRFNLVLESGNGMLLLLAAREGMGMTFMPPWMIGEDLAAGRLECVLPNALRRGGRLFGVCPSRK
jgi:DNA-binding transcriptional LysR family regulator